MATTYNDDFDDEYFPPFICHHGKEQAHCTICDEEIGDIDKCMNCGRYKASNSLTYPDQVCKKGCVNPNEY